MMRRRFRKTASSAAVRYIHGLLAAGGGMLRDSAYLLAAASAASGVIVGYTTAKATSKGLGEPEIAKRLYESQRLDSDIDYLRTRIAAEERERRTAEIGQKDAGLFRI